jgi:hypothetical protein
MSDDDFIRSVRQFDPAMLEYGGKFPKVQGDWGYLRRMAMCDALAEVYTERPIVHPLPYGPFGADADHRWIVGYRTGTGNDMTMLVDGHALNREVVPVMTPYEAFASCGDCKGSSGGCPGFAPWFPHMYRTYQYVFVVVVHYDMRWAKRYAHPGVRAKFNQLSYADLLTEKYARRLTNHIGAATNSRRMLGIGNCYGCNPKACTVLEGKPCAKPGQRTFSCEATGVDCDVLHRDLYGEWLPWSYHGDDGADGVQTYMSRYSIVFMEAGIDYPTLLDEAIKADEYGIPAAYVNDFVAFDVSDAYLGDVPAGVHKGCKQYYRSP